ncbi:hypothetical protein EWM64_g4161 [Hericium alpestre]|uniref:Alpha/beta hydrolase fold-3 domain-containing protein n=1 Tax=Hericium alpestre TaxID=135208 RepID=A0A4Z0A1W7_9AGAM|nr:hypothetical protein EWM64_g4161 [Hericium alpestre]
MSQYAHLSILDPEFAEALALFSPGSGPTQDVAEMQRGFEGLIEMLNERDKALFPCASELRIEDHKVPIDGSKITVRCMIPMPAGDSAGPFLVLVNYHAGGTFDLALISVMQANVLQGFVIGGLNTDSLWLQQACVEQQVSVVDIDYRLAPEFPWPIQHEDSYTALKWVVENTAILRADLSKGFIVGGTSAGGNISASLALRARDDPFFQGRPLTGQLLQIPPTVSPSTSRTKLISMDMPLDISGFADK